MSFVSPEQKNAMADLIRVMQAMEDSPIETPAPANTPIMESKATIDIGANYSDKDAMKEILKSFYGVAGDALEESIAVHQDARLTEAIQTTRTDNGAIIGSWEVRAKATESGRKRYDVMNPTSKEVVFEDLEIFEAAHAIVRYMNKGLQSNHAKIIEIADLEEVYRRNRQDAAIFKKRYERCVELKESAAGEVFEARWQKARAQAIIANDSIRTILENIR